MDVRDYRDLKVWQKGMDLAVDVYHLTQSLPDNEKYGLTSQLHRSAVSVPSNIAEGHAQGVTKPFVRHLRIANGSLAELETQLLLVKKLQFADEEIVDRCIARATEIRRMIQSLQKSLQRRIR